MIDPGSTHSYVCMKLVSSMNIPVENTEFMIRVSNPLGKCVTVDKVCKKCPLMIRDRSCGLTRPCILGHAHALQRRQH